MPLIFFFFNKNPNTGQTQKLNFEKCMWKSKNTVDVNKN